MKRLSFLKTSPLARRLTPLFGLSAVVAGVACGSIDDPNKSRGGNETVATISGALTGTNVPAGAHVALVWKVGNEGKYAVFSDAPVVNGSFSIALTTPPSNYFASVDQDEDYDSLSNGGSTAPPSTSLPSPTPAPTSTSSGGKEFKIDQRISPRDNVSGTITQPLNAALAGFVVYVDKNGNGKLDLNPGSEVSSPDEIVGGNKDLFLVYFKNGGGLDYEKLRDKSGILPHAGYNLAWADEERWLPLNVVELKISSSPRLPNSVCDFGTDGTDPTSSPRGSGSGTGGYNPGTTVTDAGAGYGYYPSPDDPNLVCLGDGRSFRYNQPCSYADAGPPSTTPKGLCSGGGGDDGAPNTLACPPSYGQTLSPSQPVPEGWPCPVTITDGGIDYDGGGARTDASVPIRDGGAGGDASF